MKKPHKRLLISLGLVLLGAGVIYYFLLLPLKQSNEALRTRNDDRKAALRRTGYSLNPKQLETIRGSMQSRLELLQVTLNNVYDEAMAQFANDVRVYDTVVGFRRGITQLDYQEAFNKVRRELAAKGIMLDEQVLQLSEQSTAGTTTYRLVAHMWVVRDLAELIVKHKLDVRKWDLPGVGAMQPNAIPAHIVVHPAKLYAIAKDEPVILEEYPVEVKIRGPLQRIMEFVADLTADERFLPLDTVVIERLVDENPRQDMVEATLVCSGFLIMSDKSEFTVKVTVEKRHNVPPVSRGM